MGMSALSFSLWLLKPGELASYHSRGGRLWSPTRWGTEAGLLPAASKEQRIKWMSLEVNPAQAESSDETAALADIIITTSWEILNQKHLVKPYLDSWPIETVR